jgi:hypothetical protein
MHRPCRGCSFRLRRQGVRGPRHERSLQDRNGSQGSRPVLREATLQVARQHHATRRTNTNPTRQRGRVRAAIRSVVDPRAARASAAGSCGSPAGGSCALGLPGPRAMHRRKNMPRDALALYDEATVRKSRACGCSASLLRRVEMIPVPSDSRIPIHELHPRPPIVLFSEIHLPILRLGLGCHAMQGEKFTREFFDKIQSKILQNEKRGHSTFCVHTGRSTSRAVCFSSSCRCAVVVD